MRELLFSLGKKDFIIQTFRSGGKGGQNQNKRDTGVRIIHPESGARGEARDERSQLQNRKLAFQRLVNSPAFKAWHKTKVAETLFHQKELERIVEDAMREENLKVEYGPLDSSS